MNFLYCTFHLLSNNIKINFIPSSTTHQNKYSLSLLLYVYIFLFFTCTHSCDYILHSPKLFFTTLTSVKKSSLELLFFYSSFSVYSCKCYPHAKKTIYYFMCCKQQFFLLFRCVFTVNNPMLNAFPRRPLTQTQSFLSNNSFFSLTRYHSNNWVFQLLHVCKFINILQHASHLSIFTKSSFISCWK